MCLILLSSLATANDDLLRVVPSDAWVVVHVPSVSRLIERWEASPFHRFYGDPSATEFFAPLRERVKTVRHDLSRTRGVAPDRLCSFFNGAAVLAAVPPSGDAPSNAMRWVLIFEHNGDAATLASLRRRPVVEGARVTRTPATHASFAYTQTRITHETTDASGLKRERTEVFDEYLDPHRMIHAKGDGRLIERVLDLIRRSAPTTDRPITRHPSWTRLSAKVAPNAAAPEMSIFVNIERMARGLGARRAKGGLNLNALHLDALKAARLDLRLRPDRLAVQGRLFAPEPRAGLGRLLFLGRGPIRPTAHMAPAETLSATTTRLAFAEAWPVLREMLRETHPILFGALDTQLRQAEAQTGVNVQRDLMAALGGQITRWVVPTPQNRRSRRRRAVNVYVLDARRPQAVDDALQDLLIYGSEAFGAWRVGLRAVGGRSVLTLRSGRPGSQHPGKPLFHYSVAEGWLIASRSWSALVATLEQMDAPGGEGGLSGRAAWRAVARERPEGRVWEGFGDLAAARSLLEAAPLPGVADAAEPWVNLAALPERATWDGYLGPMGGSRSIDGECLTLDLFILYPGFKRPEAPRP